MGASERYLVGADGGHSRTARKPQARRGGTDVFIVEMARHASVIEDWPLPDVESEDVHSLLPAAVEVSIVAVEAGGGQWGSS